MLKDPHTLTGDDAKRFQFDPISWMKEQIRTAIETDPLTASTGKLAEAQGWGFDSHEFYVMLAFYSLQAKQELSARSIQMKHAGPHPVETIPAEKAKLMTKPAGCFIQIIGGVVAIFGGFKMTADQALFSPGLLVLVVGGLLLLLGRKGWRGRRGD